MTNLKPYLIGAALGVLGLGFVPLSGLVPSSAEPKQATVLDWYFNLAAQQAITLRSLWTEEQPLDVAGMAERGAGHYEMVCAACHGSPVAKAEQIAENLSPAPPPLVERMAQWHPPARVFATVKHGIRRTAMPGWPSQLRDDEVWDMVAFLVELPEMDGERYAELTRLEVGSCGRCHGEAGDDPVAGTPRLDIQTPAYLEAALKAFRDGTRESGTMKAAARSLTDDQIMELAQHFGRQVEVPGANASAAARIVSAGVPERDVPACDSCHGDDRRDLYPSLAGQDAEYLFRQLKLFKEAGTERGGPFGHVMAEVVRFLEEDEMRALADWYGQAPEVAGSE
jgi:cytochrome c553